MKTTQTWVRRDPPTENKVKKINWWRLCSLSLGSLLSIVLMRHVIMNQAVLENLDVATSKCDYGRVVATKKDREIVFRCDESPAAVTDEYIDLINAEREKLGTSRLVRNTLLEQSAQLKACDMFNDNYFEHTDPEGRTISWWAKSAGYEFITFGENIAHETGGANETHAKFMQSESHREIITDPDFQELGVSKCGPYVVEHFGSFK